MNFFKKLSLSAIFGISLLSAIQFVQPAVIVWDIGETLVKADGLKCWSYLGRLDMLNYIRQYYTNKLFGYRNLGTIEIGKSFTEHMKNLFYTLALIPSPMENDAPYYKNEIKGVDGRIMPALQRDFLLGKITSKEVIDIVEDWIEKNNFI